ncbi:uncharacterized protein APUU_30352S [Aspergillus puulaauensis]|uniref:Uncharacterized protein n=1 Tax=Aspergillus puulaauensis TaxID=1220207 RepID=A0A7R7XIX2_9EURO|nr:uncharacterized protein APUU_30352S [Aspergillus puulaauensis]BCS22127.1 hypothetical protein APUU_30352S [Aspergillus puulaauensis]
MCFYQPNPVGCKCTFFQLVQPCAFARFLPPPHPAQNPNPLIVPCTRKDIAQGVGVRICTHCQAWYGGMAAPMAAPTVVPMSNGMETGIYDSDSERDTMYRNPMIEWMERYDCGYESENTSSGTAGTVNGTVSGSESVEGQRPSTSLTLPDPSPVETSFQDSSRLPVTEYTEEETILGESTEWFGIGGSYLATGDQTQGEDQDQAQGCIHAIADEVGVDFAAVEEWREVTLEERAGTEATLEEESEGNNAIGKVEDDEEEGDDADAEPLRLPIILKADNKDNVKTGDDL